VFRIAAIHEWLPARAGSEKTFEQIALAFPDADLYALNRDPDVDFVFGGRQLTTTFLDRGSLRDKRASVLPIMPLAWRMLRTPKEPYDLAITSSHAFANLAEPTRRADVVLSYCYTPARYLWSPEIDQQRSRLEPLLDPARALLRHVDLRGAARVTEFAAISTDVAARIRRFYGRDARVIAPPVETDFYADDAPGQLTPEEERQVPEGDFLLAMSRFIPYKRIDLAIRTAERVGLPMVVAGSGGDEERLRGIADELGHEVHFVIGPSQQLLRELFRRARLLLFLAYEDFGIVPVEAQACGTPVIGYAAGGALDTIVAGSTGELAANQKLDDFVEATERALDGIVADPATADRCRANAAGFSSARFRAEMIEWVGEHVS
jgi:glycosyltransferase involved in cell wall biosynthesis